MHTFQTVSDFIQARWESDLPDQVIEALKPYHGKPITTRLLNKLPGGKDQWRMSRNYGWTEIETVEYRRTQGNSGIRLILARSEASVLLDLAIVESENPAYFAGRRERNHKRREARNDKQALDAMAAVLNQIERAQAELAKATEAFDTLTAYGEVFEPERYAFRKLVSMDKE